MTRKKKEDKRAIIPSNCHEYSGQKSGIGLQRMHALINKSNAF